MLERDGGRDRAGVGSHDPTFWHPPGYVSAKHGVIGLTKTAALDYADHNPRVKARAPGPILTDNLRRAGAQAQAAAAAVMPMRRVGQPEEVAWTAVSLCSDQARFITDAILPIDGGKLAGTPNVPNHPPATSR
jgi:NAD(P)-dependent dehydrogenase (short-subunit alcohol dehydrogenase family)